MSPAICNVCGQEKPEPKPLCVHEFVAEHEERVEPAYFSRGDVKVSRLVLFCRKCGERR